MNGRIMFGVLTVFLLLPSRTQGQGYDFFHPNDFSVDLNGFVASRDRGGADKAAAGPGVGVNYFFTKNVGIGADTYADAFQPPYQLNASGIYRYPLGSTGVSPYGFAGFGRQWDNHGQWLAHVGAGLEFRFSERTGVFLDVREVFPDKTRDSTVVRFGFRVKFLQ